MPEKLTPEDLLTCLDRTSVSDELSGKKLNYDEKMLRIAILPAASAISERLTEARRLLVAVSGPPGSGKSSFVKILSQALNVLMPEAANKVIGMDGWHYPNTFLDSTYFERDGEGLPLRTVKGAPNTFDARAFCDFVRRIPIHDELSYPVYSRKTHEPQANGACINKEDRIILLEGNYLLLDEAPWNEIMPLYDLSIFLSAKRVELLPGLIARKAAGGSTFEAAARHVQSVDLPNIDLVLRHSLPADLTFSWDDYRC